mgnify:CR=1 FL=1
MFVCKRTGEAVEISELENYPFYSPEIDEDLFLFETSPDVSQEAWAEAKGLIALRCSGTSISSLVLACTGL